MVKLWDISDFATNSTNKAYLFRIQWPNIVTFPHLLLPRDLKKTKIKVI